VLFRARAEGLEPYIKRDFIIDPRLPRPDIYWFHMDGMMSLEMMEDFKYLGKFLRNQTSIQEERD
jgi:hypothetical protein